MGNSGEIRKVNKWGGKPINRDRGELNRGVDVRENYRHDVRGPFMFEWYFNNAWFDNGYGMTATFVDHQYSKFNFSRKGEIQLSIYLPDGSTINRIYHAPRDKFEYSWYNSNVRMQDDFMLYESEDDMNKFHLFVDQGDFGVDLIYEAAVPSYMPGTGEIRFPLKRWDLVTWMLPMPRANVHGTITVSGETIPVKGTGEAERNWGDCFMPLFIDNWHWCLYYEGDVGLICWDMMFVDSLDNDHIYELLVMKGDQLVYESAEFSMTYEDWKLDTEYDFPYPGKTVVTFEGDGGRIKGDLTIRPKAVADTQDLLQIAGVPKPIGKLIRKSGMMEYLYTRFHVQFDGFVEIDGEKTVLGSGGYTLNEQMLMRGKWPKECYADSR